MVKQSNMNQAKTVLVQTPSAEKIEFCKTALYTWLKTRVFHLNQPIRDLILIVTL